MAIDKRPLIRVRSAKDNVREVRERYAYNQ